MSKHIAGLASAVLVLMISAVVRAQPITQVHSFYESTTIAANADNCMSTLIGPLFSNGEFAPVLNRYYYKIQRSGLGYFVADPFQLSDDYGTLVIACQPGATQGTQVLVFSASTNPSWAEVFSKAYVNGIAKGGFRPPPYDTGSLGTGQQVPVDVGGIYSSAKSVNDEIAEAIEALSKAGLSVTFERGFVFGQGAGVRVVVSIVPFNPSNSISGITPLEAKIAKTTVLVVTAATSQASAHNYLKAVVNNITRTTIPPTPAQMP